VPLPAPQQQSDVVTPTTRLLPAPQVPSLVAPALYCSLDEYDHLCRLLWGAMSRLAITVPTASLDPVLAALGAA